MRCLSVKNPWAEMIRRGHKTIELRTWSTQYRGPLLIVSSVNARNHSLLDRYDGPRGAARVLVDLFEVRTAVKRDADAAGCDVSPGEYAWVLRNPRPVPSILIQGRLSLFEVPDHAWKPLAVHFARFADRRLLPDHE